LQLQFMMVGAGVVCTASLAQVVLIAVRAVEWKISDRLARGAASWWRLSDDPCTLFYTASGRPVHCSHL